MINQLMIVMLSSITLITTSQALDKNTSYQIINECKYLVQDKKVSNEFLYGYILGIAQAYNDVLSGSNIDNDYAGLKTGDYSKKMCSLALEYRKMENKESGGKYDVTRFASDLSTAGYIMTLPPKQNTDANKKD